MFSRYGVGMFVKTTRRRRGDKTYEYLSLVESVRDGAKTSHRTLLRLGEVTALRRSGRLDRIVAALQKHLETEENGRVDVAELEADGAPAVGGVACAAAVWQRLGLDGRHRRRGSTAGPWMGSRISKRAPRSSCSHGCAT